jgi:hypothetical protein
MYFLGAAEYAPRSNHIEKGNDGDGDKTLRTGLQIPFGNMPNDT